MLIPRNEYEMRPVQFQIYACAENTLSIVTRDVAAWKEMLISSVYVELKKKRKRKKKRSEKKLII